MSIKLEVEVQDVQLVLAGLAKLPLENSIDTWFKVKNQAEAQLSEQNPPGQQPAPADNTGAGE